MKQTAYVLFGALFTAVTSYSLGRLALRRVGAQGLYRQEESGFAFLLGSAILSWLVFALSAAHLVHKGVFVALGAAAIAMGLRRSEAPPLPPLPRGWAWAAALPVTLFSVLYLAHAMAPEMSPDGSAYHLGLVARYYREHGFPAITTNIYANLSQGTEMLFLFAFAWGKHSAAALTHLTFLFALAWLMLSYARRFAFPLAGIGGALLVFFSPVVGIDAASAYIDVAVAAVVFAVYYLAQIWERERWRALLPVLGALAGFAFAMKYTAFLALPFAAGFVMWKSRRWRAAATVVLAASLWIAPWLIKNTIVVGNPVSPFFNRVFPNPYVTAAFEDQYREHMRRYDLPGGYASIPLEVTVRGNALCGLLGPAFLLAPLALLAWRLPHGPRLLFAAALFGSVYVTNIGTRFLIPALPFVALAMAAALARWPAVLALILTAHAAASWPDLMRLYCHQYAWRLDRVWWKQALRIESEDGFLARRWPSYTTARMIEQTTPPQARVFTFSQTGEAYTSREIIVGYQSAFGQSIGAILWMPLIAEYQPTRATEFRIPETAVSRVRVRQTASGAPDHFTVTEIRILRGAHELPRDARWRLTARPRPWTVQDAFDNSPVTRWSSWEPLRPGMFVEAAFGRSEAVTAVVVESSPDAGRVRVELDYQQADGAWHTARDPLQYELPPPLGLRREATAVLRARGITHLLVHEGDFGATDYHERRDDWGLVYMGERFGFRLYALR